MNLRSLNDARFVRDALTSPKNVVIVGAGLIGGRGVNACEHRMSCSSRVSEVRHGSLMLATYGYGDRAPPSHRWRRNHLEAGIDPREGGPTSRRYTYERAKAGSEHLPVRNRCITQHRTGTRCRACLWDGILVDQFMRTSDPGILAVGDCTAFPSTHLGVPIRLECIQNAHEQAASAAATLVGACRPCVAPPVSWSNQKVGRFQMVGFLDGVDMTVKRKGKTGAFSLWHFADRHLRVVESVNNTHEHALAHQILAKQAHLPPEQLADLASSCALPYWLRDHCSHFQGVAHIVTEQWTRKYGAAAGRYHKTFPQVLRPDHRIGQQFTQALRDAIAKRDQSLVSGCPRPERSLSLSVLHGERSLRHSINSTRKAISRPALEAEPPYEPDEMLQFEVVVMILLQQLVILAAYLGWCAYRTFAKRPREP